MFFSSDIVLSFKFGKEIFFFDLGLNESSGESFYFTNLFPIIHKRNVNVEDVFIFVNLFDNSNSIHRDYLRGTPFVKEPPAFYKTFKILKDFFNITAINNPVLEKMFRKTDLFAEFHVWDFKRFIGFIKCEFGNIEIFRSVAQVEHFILNHRSLLKRYLDFFCVGSPSIYYTNFLEIS